MAIQFKEIRKYLARNTRLSICFEDGHYHDYLMVSDIPAEKYKNLYVYGVGMADVEFSKDIYAPPKELDGVIISTKDYTIEPAIEIVLHEAPRNIERKAEDVLLFKDLKPYLQIGRNFAVVNKDDWSYEVYEYRSEIPDNYDDMFVYGIGMEDNLDADDPKIINTFEGRKFETYLDKRMVIVLSNAARTDIENEKNAFGKGPFFLLVTADGWNHDDDRWIGIYVSKKEAREAYDRAVVWWEEERKFWHYSAEKRVAMFEYLAEEDSFREVERKELEEVR